MGRNSSKVWVRWCEGCQEVPAEYGKAGQPPRWCRGCVCHVCGEQPARPHTYVDTVTTAGIPLVAPACGDCWGNVLVECLAHDCHTPLHQRDGELLCEDCLDRDDICRAYGDVCGERIGGTIAGEGVCADHWAGACDGEASRRTTDWDYGRE